jgi:hypothetical protein
MRAPAVRIPIIDPTARPKSTRPICAVEASMRSRMTGVCVTHVAMLSPHRRKIVAMAVRRRRTIAVSVDKRGLQG